jgi:23S rRNA (uracil1939-C5)-methyltransferase
MESLVQAGPHRRAAPCPVYDVCGGCTLQHLEYPEQLVWKSRIVEEALARIGHQTAAVSELAPSTNEFGYRNRMSFTLRRLRNGRVVAGLHELERASRIFDLTGSCLLADPLLNETWRSLRSAWGPGARALPPGGELRLTLRKAEEGVVLAIRGGKPGGDAAHLVEAVEPLVAVWHQEERAAPVLLAGRADTTEAWLDESFPVRATAFLQVNREAGEHMHGRVLELAGAGGGTVVDAYCGAGTYGRALARGGRVAVGIEQDPEAAKAAATDAPAGFTVVHGTVEERLAGSLPADTVILNPPRSGLDGSVPEVLLSEPPQRIVYVSCDPATLARDVGRLSSGFGITHVECFDLFPQTAHVETLMVLERQEVG